MQHDALLRARGVRDCGLPNINDTLLRNLILAGRVAGSDRRVAAITAECKKQYREPYPTPDQLAVRVVAIDDVLQRLYQLRLMIANASEWSLSGAERAHLRAAGARLVGKSEALAAEWTEFVFPNERAGGSEPSAPKRERVDVAE